MFGKHVITESLLKNLDDGFLKNWLQTVLPEFIGFFWSIVLALIVYFVGRKIITFICKVFRKSLDRTNVEDGLAGFLQAILKNILYIVLFVIILGLFGITTSSIAAAVAALGVTAGLSLQGALSNFAGGCLILILHPFRVGDYIIEDSCKNEGTVTNISIIYTTLCTLDGRTVVIPNGTLANCSLTNCTSIKMRMFNETIGISYDSDIKKAKEIMYDIALQAPNRVENEPIKVFVADLGDSAVKIGLRFWIKPDDFWQTKWDTLEKIKTEFDKNGVEICFNQLDVHINNK